MAGIGLKTAKYNQIDYATKKYKALTGSAVPLLGKIIDEKFAPEYNSAELYANDSLAESDYSFKSGSITVTVANDDDTIDAELMGNTIATSEVTRNISDKSAETGYAHVVPMLVGGVKKFKVEFFPRVKWQKITTDRKTKGEGVEFGTTTIEGKVLPLAETINGLVAGDWEQHQTFDTETAANTYLDACLTPST